VFLQTRLFQKAARASPNGEATPMRSVSPGDGLARQDGRVCVLTVDL
jgi:hypothetical protein